MWFQKHKPVSFLTLPISPFAFIKETSKAIYSVFSRVSKVQLSKNPQPSSYLGLKEGVGTGLGFTLVLWLSGAVYYFKISFLPLGGWDSLLFQISIVFNTDVICSLALLPWQCLEAFETQIAHTMLVIHLSPQLSAIYWFGP